MEKDIFNCVRKEIRETDGLVDETRVKLDEWFEGCEYLQANSQIFGLAEKTIPMEYIPFDQLKKEDVIRYQTDRKFTVQEKRSYIVGNKTVNDLIVREDNGRIVEISPTEWKFFKISKDRVFAIFCSSHQQIYEKQQKDLEKRSPDWIEAHLKRIEKVEIYLPEEMMVIYNIRDKCRALLEVNPDNKMDEILKQPVYLENETVISLLKSLDNGNSFPKSKEIESLISELNNQGKRLVSLGIFKIDISANREGKIKISKYFLKEPPHPVAESNTRQLIRHFAKQYRKNCLELITYSDLTHSLHGICVQDVFHVPKQFSLDPLLRTIFPDEFAQYDRVQDRFGQLSAAEKRTMNRTLFRYQPLKYCSEEEKIALLENSRNNAIKALNNLIGSKKLQAEREGQTFFPALLTVDDIRKQLSGNLYCLFGARKHRKIELMMKAIPEEFQEVNEKTVSFLRNFQGSNKAKIELVRIFLNPGELPNLSKQENLLVRRRSFAFACLLIRDFIRCRDVNELTPSDDSDKSSDRHMLEDFTAIDLHEISGKAISKLTKLPENNIFAIMRTLFPLEYGILTKEKLSILRNRPGSKTKDRLSRIFFSDGKIDHLDANVREKIKKQSQENVRKALKYLEKDQKKPIILMTSKEIRKNISRNVFRLFGFEEGITDMNQLLFAILGNEYRNLHPDSLDWLLRHKEYFQNGHRDPVISRIFDRNSPDYLSPSEQKEFLEISQANARLVVEGYFKRENKYLENFNRQDFSLLSGYVLNKIFFPDSSSDYVYSAGELLFRMYPKDFGNLDEKKLETYISEQDPYKKRTWSRRFFRSSIGYSDVCKKNSRLSASEREQWRQRVKNNWLRYILFSLYQRKQTIYDTNHSFMRRYYQCVNLQDLAELFKPDGILTIQTIYSSITKNFTREGKDDYLQFFWRNIIKFTPNPREFFDLEKENIGRFQECLEVLPEIWLEIGTRILTETSDENKPVEEAIPCQVQMVKHIAGALDQGQLKGYAETALQLLYSSIKHVAPEVRKSALGSILQKIDVWGDNARDSFKEFLATESYHPKQTEIIVAEMGTKELITWETLQREVNDKLRNLLLPNCKEEIEKLKGDIAVFLSWKRAREALKNIGMEYLSKREKELLEKAVSLDDVLDLYNLHTSPFPWLQERIAIAFGNIIPRITNEIGRLIVLKTLPYMLGNKNPSVHASGMKIVSFLSTSVESEVGIDRLKERINKTLETFYK